MQTVHSRMRRAVEKENRDIDRNIGGGNKSKKKRRPRQRFNFGLLLLVLSPVAIIGAGIYLFKQYAIWSAADADLENLMSPETALNKSKRLRNRGTGVEGDAAKRIRIDEKRIVDNAKRRQNMRKNVEKETTQNPHKFLVLTTIHGNIKITLRPDLSKGSIDYIYKLVESYGGSGKKCLHCQFYRSEKPGILQGIMEHKDVVPVNTVKGSCPPDAEGVGNDCPEWDKQCGCHGPVMTRGAVAWAAGDAGGPDFFIDGYPDPADFWGTQHTNFGFIEDHSSLEILDAIWELPIESTPDMDFLKDPIHFDLVLE